MKTEQIPKTFCGASLFLSIDWKHFIMLWMLILFWVLMVGYSTECDGNTFGQDCADACGKCVNGEQCHYINGTCLNGCDRGFQGLECNQGKTFSFLADYYIGNLSFHIHK